MSDDVVHPFYRKGIPDDIWKILSERYVVDIVGNFSPIKFRIVDRVTNESVELSDNSRTIVAFFKEKAEEVQKTIEKIILG